MEQRPAHSLASASEAAVNHVHGRGANEAAAAMVLSEVLLRDLRVADAYSVLVEVGRRGHAYFPCARRAMLHLVLDGTALLKTAESDECVKLSAGDSALLLYGDRHSIFDTLSSPPTGVAIPEWSQVPETPSTIHVGAQPVRAVILSCALDLTYMSPSAFVNRAAPECWVMRKDNNETTSTLTVDVRHVRTACNGLGATAFVTMLASLLLVHMLRDIYANCWHDRAVEVRAPNTRRITAAVRKIHGHLDRTWTVAELAQEVGLSRSTFAEAFRAYMGAAPATYVTEERMKRAAQLLEIDSITLREVSVRVGYKLEASFARAFKQYYGVSPRHFAARRR